MTTEILLHRDVAADWTTANPVLGEGEPGFELDTGRLKIGDGVTAWNALAYLGAAGKHSVAKTADEQVAGSTALQNDDHLSFPVAAGEVWHFVVYLHLSCASGTPDFKCNTSVPAAATLRRHGMIGQVTTANAVETSARIQSHTSGDLIVGVPPSATADTHAIYDATVEVGGTAGTVNFRWAQNNVDAQPTILRRGSVLIATRIGG